MPVFRLRSGKVAQLAPAAFGQEKELQNFVEGNLDVLLGLRLVASEFSTGEKHGGRIDTLALDESGNPTIIEYKWDKSDSVINQGLFYLDWLIDHKGDFAVAAQKRLGDSAHVQWQGPRLIIIASAFTKYDSYAVNQLTLNIELLRYQRYADDVFVLDTVFAPLSSKSVKPGPAVTPAKAVTQYGLEYHLTKTSEPVRTAFLELRDKLLALEGVTERANQKSQITYRTTKSFAAFDFRKRLVFCQFKGGDKPPGPAERVKNIRSYNWGYQWACELKSMADVNSVFELIRGAYEFEL